MVRPRKPDEEKRQLIGARFDPADRRRIELAAKESGRSPNAEVERRVKVTLGLDEEGLQLIGEVVTHLLAVQAITGKRWHKDLRTWAAIAEVFANGPIEDRKPKNAVDEEVQTNVWKDLSSIEEMQRKIARKLSGMGVPVSHRRRQTRGLGGTSNSRDLELAAISAIPNPQTKSEATVLHRNLSSLDDEREAAEQAFREAMQPYWDEEAKGRIIYQNYLHDEALRNKERGEAFSLQHLLRMFGSWR